MAADGMVLTNHDHQTRVGILTGKDNVVFVRECCHGQTAWRRRVAGFGVTITDPSPLRASQLMLAS